MNLILMSGNAPSYGIGSGELDCGHLVICGRLEVVA
jgi:hypothetical protein